MNSGAVSKKRQIIASLSVLIVIAVIVGNLTLTKDGTENENTATTSESTTATSVSSDAASNDSPATKAISATYKDGSYSAIGGYNSPGGAEKIEVSIILKNGIITDTSTEGLATSGEAESYQGDFVGAFKEFVVGKSIDQLRLSRVAGASLTTGGFNNAITQIKSQAKS